MPSAYREAFSFLANGRGQRAEMARENVTFTIFAPLISPPFINFINLVNSVNLYSWSTCLPPHTKP
jgi:hypothetical protein